MKRIRVIIPVLAVAALLPLFGFLLLKEKGSRKLDIVLVNDMVKSAASQWEDMKEGMPYRKPEEAQGVEYVIFSPDGDVLSSWGKDTPGSIYEAVARRGTPVDITAGSKVLGKLVILNPLEAQNQQIRNQVFLLLCCISLFLVLILLWYLIYLNKVLFRPFQKLRGFARRVAEGNLDIPLEMDRKNFFGAFTESFDLMREELKAAQIREQAAARSKKELVAKLSHDIKTPVASIQAVSELMALTARGEKEKKQLEIIGEKARQIDRLISDLFQAALEELSELTVKPEIQESGKLAGMLGRADYLERGIQDPIPECMLLFDERRLQQVFDNVFGNSYKYAESSIRITFSCDHTGLLVNISDRGPGVNPEELPLLFQKFYRGGNATDKNGSGLGLFISSYLMEQMGGSISAGNTEDGFCVKLFLRLA